MKNRLSIKSVLAVATSACLLHSTPNYAEDPGSNTVVTARAAPAAESVEPKARVRLSRAAAEVLKLSQAKVGEGTMVAFIVNSGSTYNLTVSEILYLREQGVSDFVITTMLDRDRKLTERYRSNTAGSEATNSTAPVVFMPFTNAAVTAPLVPNAATMYGIPQSLPGYYYDDYNGYYPDYGYWGPGWPFGIGFAGPPRGGPGHAFRGGGPPGGGPPGGGIRGGGPGRGGPGGGGPRGGGPGGGGGRGGGPGGR